MRVSTLKSDNIISGKCFSFPALYPRAISAFRVARNTDSTERKPGGSERTSGLLVSVRKALASPSKRCIECLEDISKDDERCPHCRTLQSSEVNLLRGRDTGWN